MAGDTVITVIGNLTADPELRWTRKGMRVIVQGRLTQRSYDTQQGERRTVVELQVDEVGPSLRRARAQVTRTAPSGGGGYQSDNRGQQGAPQQGGGYGGGQGGYGQGGANYGAPTGGSPEDPWRSAPAGGATSFGDEPPF